MDERVVFETDHRMERWVNHDRPTLPVLHPQHGRGREFVAVESRVRGLDAEAPKANQVRLERFTIRASPVPTGARQGFLVRLSFVSRPGSQRHTLRNVDDVLPLTWPPLHGAALVASRIGPAFLLDRVQANAGHECFRVVQSPVVVMFHGKRACIVTRHCQDKEGYQF